MGWVLVTGAAGFIGWKTCEFLLREGRRVLGVDNLNDYYDPGLKAWRRDQLLRHSGFRFFELDIENYGALRLLFETFPVEAVINLAARAGVRASIEDPWVYYRTNVEGTLNLLELMRRYGVRKMVLASTSSVYAGSPLPYREDLPVNRPLSPYAASKKAAEVLAYSYHHLYGLDISVVRYFTVYGPAGRPDMSYFRFIKWIDEGHTVVVYGDGTQARDFTYVDDIARGTILALRPLGYEIINLGGGRNPVSINTLIEKIEKILGKKARVEYREFHRADMKVTWAEIEKAKKLLSWEPKVDLDEGLARTVEWYLENRHWLKEISV
ncbi:NAD-dependent epimerase/dehydratase family protein [Thermosulfurimonas sp. F29]|uniref:NAD-dependent epimerase/dehydratase family protein n=1 Tax=Thermosulfurimonas sp. F29 TaxID=2867247 RepID=UPI001C83C86E|nr:NAD-dependent epimerase/dehydratase family protein [Thermosulfurimonas sp. F29]MBX6422735.1 NAD-dependent epimerase/dehydratase family protein [Thermosulfurimonas sp. F29]